MVERKQLLIGIRATNDEAESYSVVQQQTFSDMDALACQGQEL